MELVNKSVSKGIFRDDFVIEEYDRSGRVTKRRDCIELEASPRFCANQVFDNIAVSGLDRNQAFEQVSAVRGPEVYHQTRASTVSRPTDVGLGR